VRKRNVRPVPSGSAAFEAAGGCRVLAYALRRSSRHQRVEVPARRSGARGWSANGWRLLHTPRSPQHSIALRPHVAARSSMRGASWPAMEADGRGRDTLIQSGGTAASPFLLIVQGPLAHNQE
jgi:hypothetical protein